jgi:hypothetical protein
LNDNPNQFARNDAAVRVARETLAHASTAAAGIPEMTRVELCALIGTLTGSLLGLVEYVDLTQTIAEHQRFERETRARLAEMSTPKHEDSRIATTRRSLADLDAATWPLGENAHYWLGRIQRCAEMLIDYIDGTDSRPTPAPAVHTGALDHQLADALHTADRVHFTTDHDADDAHRHAVEAWSGSTHVMAVRATPGEALTAAMTALKAAAQVTR